MKTRPSITKPSVQGASLPALTERQSVNLYFCVRKLADFRHSSIREHESLKTQKLRKL